MFGNDKKNRTGLPALFLAFFVFRFSFLVVDAILRGKIVAMFLMWALAHTRCLCYRNNVVVGDGFSVPLSPYRNNANYDRRGEPMSSPVRVVLNL